MNLNAFICPSDGLTGQYNNNNYFGSIGTTPGFPNGCNLGGSNCQGGSTGIFAHLLTYSIANVTDGTSNTIAFSEGLVSDSLNGTRWRDDLSTRQRLWCRIYAPRCQYEYPCGPADLQTCSTWWTQKTNYPTVACAHGFRWGVGDPGDSLFQTLVPPNSSTYQWADCRMDCGAACGAVFTGYHNATSNHPGGANTAMADGSVRFVKSSIAMHDVVGLGYQDQRGGHQFRLPIDFGSGLASDIIREEAG